MPDDSSLPAQLVEIGTQLPSTLPKSVEIRLLQAATQLIGSALAIPRAFFKQWAQGIEDQTAARSAITEQLAKSVGEQIKSDPVVLAAAIEKLSPPFVRKAVNRARMVAGTVEELVESARINGGYKSGGTERLDEDWIARFTRYCEDATSERLQSLFSKVLAGEILAPGSFSITTLRVLSELTPQLANDFNKVWPITIGGILPHPDKYHSDDLMSVTRLTYAGFFASNTLAIRSEDYGNDIIIQVDNYKLHISYPDRNDIDAYANIPFLPLTEAGQQIGSILPPRNVHNVLRQMAFDCDKNFVNKIVLTTGEEEELIYQKFDYD